MAVIIQLRRDTAANWTSNNPTLAQGELGIETDTDLIKVGDGIHTWTVLSYLQTQGSQGIQGPPGNSPTQVTLDFGSIPTYSKGFSFSDAIVTTASKILITAAADSDEYEMDGFSCAAYCAVNGTIKAFIQAFPGPVVGTRKFNYILG